MKRVPRKAKSNGRRGVRNEWSETEPMDEEQFVHSLGLADSGLAPPTERCYAKVRNVAAQPMNG